MSYLKFTFKLTITDKKGKLVRNVLACSEDEIKRMKAALYWTLNHRLKLGYSYSVIDLEEERKRKIQEQIEWEKQENERLKATAGDTKKIAEQNENLTPEQSIMKMLDEKFSILQNRLQAIEAMKGPVITKQKRKYIKKAASR